MWVYNSISRSIVEHFINYIYKVIDDFTDQNFIVNICYFFIQKTTDRGDIGTLHQHLLSTDSRRVAESIDNY